MGSLDRGARLRLGAMTASPEADVRVADDHGSPLVVFAHGAMDRGSAWDKVRRRLGHMSTLAYDRRGYAGSVDLPFSCDAFADHVGDLKTLLAAHTDGRPVVLVGHSAGSNIVLAVAQSEPTVVCAAVVFEPPMPWAPWWPSSAGGSTLAVHAELGPEAAAEAFMRRIVGDRVWDRLPETTRQARRREGTALYEDLSTLRGRPVQFDHNAIVVPVVVGRGDRSLPHHREASAATAAAIPRSVLVDLPEQGHGAHASDPAGFVGLIELALTLSS